jgi:hypothetical protein
MRSPVTGWAFACALAATVLSLAAFPASAEPQICTPGQTQCGRSAGCVNLASNVAHCGSCGHTCSVGQACSNGMCRGGAPQTCTPGQTLCGRSAGCVNIASNPAHCGSCGHSCGVGQACSNGMCRGRATDLYARPDALRPVGGLRQPRVQPGPLRQLWSNLRRRPDVLERDVPGAGAADLYARPDPVRSLGGLRQPRLQPGPLRQLRPQLQGGPGVLERDVQRGREQDAWPVRLPLHPRPARRRHYRPQQPLPRRAGGRRLQRRLRQLRRAGQPGALKRSSGLVRFIAG